MTITLDEATHIYYVDGVPKRSASDILRPLLDDLSNVPTQHLANAKARGSQVHDASALLMEGKLASDAIKLINNEAWPFVEAYARYWMQHAPRTPVRVETPLYCERLDYCCTPDWFDDLSVNDIKTQDRATRTWGLQTALQALAHGTAQIRRIIWLRPKLKSRQFEVHISDQEADRRIFSPLDFPVVEAACRGDYEADVVRRWRAGE